MAGIENEATTPITEKDQTIRLAKNMLVGQLPRPHLFIPPEHIALWVTALGQQSVRKADRLHRLAVIYGPNFDAGLFLKIAEDFFRISLVLRTVGDDSARRLCVRTR